MSLSTRDSTYDAGPPLLRDVWGLTGVAILIVILRIVAKLRIGKFGADDLLVAFAVVSKPFILLFQILDVVKHCQTCFTFTEN